MTSDITGSLSLYLGSENEPVMPQDIAKDNSWDWEVSDHALGTVVKPGDLRSCLGTVRMSM